MKKVIALSTLLALGALGMACDSAPANNANTNTKPANLSTPTPAATLAPANTGNSTGANTGNSTGANTGNKMANTEPTKKP